MTKTQSDMEKMISFLTLFQLSYKLVLCFKEKSLINRKKYNRPYHPIICWVNISGQDAYHISYFACARL